MDIVHVIWLSAAVGAGLFFAAGLALAGIVLPRFGLPRSNAEGAADTAAQTEAQELAGRVLALDEQLHEALSARHALEVRLQALTESGARAEAELTRLRAAAANRSVPPPPPQNAQQQAELSKAREQIRKLEAEALARRGLQRELSEAQAQLARVAADATKLEKAESALGEAESALSEAQRRVQELGAELTQARAELAQRGKGRRTEQDQRDEVDRLRGELAEAQAQLAQLAAARDAEQDRQRLAAEDHTRLAADLQSVRAQLRDAAAQVVNLEVRAREVDRLREENSALRVDLGEHERRAAQDPGVDLSSFQRRNAELSLRAKVLEQRAAEFERQAHENHELRMRAEHLEALRAENEVLVRRLRELEARSFAAAPVAPAPRAPVTLPAGSSWADHVQEALETLVGQDPSCKVAVLSDPSGLLIAAAGDPAHQEELAAVASLTTYTSERVGELLPLASPQSFEWIDDNRVALRTSWLRSDDDLFLLTTLSLGGVAPNRGAATVGARLAALMGATVETSGAA